jgi:cobalt/nickel transport protein
MHNLLRRIAAVLGLFLLSTPAWAHYHMLLPQVPATARDKSVTFLLQWGHPFEHQLFDAGKPESFVVLAPDRKTTDLLKALKESTLKSPEAKPVVVYHFAFVPPRRGDYAFVLTAPPVWMEEEKEFYQDTVRVSLHVATQNGWDNALDKGFEMVPLTRPYGLQPGMVFQAQARVGGKPLAGALVEIERYNPSPPKELPPDEHITRKVRADPNGVATCTLTEPGWWCITALRDGGVREHQGKKYPVRQRSTLWVYVDPKS